MVRDCFPDQPQNTTSIVRLSFLDVAETISEFYSQTTHVKPPPKTVLSNYDVDNYLHELGQVTREQDQIQLLRQITEKCTVNDLRMFIRLVQKDLVKIKLILFHGNLPL